MSSVHHTVGNPTIQVTALYEGERSCLTFHSIADKCWLLSDPRRRYHWVSPTHSYTNQVHLLTTLKEHIIIPAEQKAQELEKW